MATIKKKFFIGFSRKYLLFADALKEGFANHPTIEAVTWSDFFKAGGGGNYAYESLLKALGEFEFAVFFITPDWELKTLKTKSYAATPNLWFEAGLFMSRYGKENVLLLEEEQDQYNKSIQFLTDLDGLQPEYYELDKGTKKFLNPRAKIPSWKSISKIHKTHKLNIIKALEKIKSKIEVNITDDFDRIFDTINNLGSREACYKEGEKIIKEAKEFVFSIVSYENEYEDSKNPNGLLPFIENKLKELKKSKHFSQEKSREMFKRWMNIGNDNIAKQAEKIISSLPGLIEIRDTYCNFIEVLITENRVLIVLPKPKDNKTQIGRGIVIKSEKIAKEFAVWFEHLVPEPNSINLDTLQKLSAYRNLEWSLQNKRKEGIDKNKMNFRCNACFVKWHDQPANIKKKLKAHKLK